MGGAVRELVRLPPRVLLEPVVLPAFGTGIAQTGAGMREPMGLALVDCPDPLADPAAEVGTAHPGLRGTVTFPGRWLPTVGA